MKRISESIRQEIVERIDLQEYIGAFVPLKRSGDHFSGRCPFHDDSSPSFHVWRDHFHCFGCRKSGDVFEYEMARSGSSFPQAVEALATRVGLNLVSEEENPEKIRLRQERKRLQSILEGCADHYHALLLSNEGEEARHYLFSRGFDEKVLPLWKLGLAPNRSEITDLAQRRGWNIEDLKTLGLIREKPEEQRAYDFFRRRIMIPIRDERGVCTAFAGRVFEQADIRAKDKIPKFINSPESSVYSKSRVLFNLDRARAEIARSGDVVVVEGYMDCTTLVNAGVPNVVAVSGTALTEHHVRLLSKCAKRVILCFDSDTSGQAAALRSFSIAFPLGLVELLFLAVPQGKDPDEFVRAEGSNAFRAIMAKAVPLLDRVCSQAVESHSTRESLVRYFKREIVPVVSRHPDLAIREIALESVRATTGLSSAALLTEAPGEGGSGRISLGRPMVAQNSEPVENRAALPYASPHRNPALCWAVGGPLEIRLVVSLGALRRGEVAGAVPGGLPRIREVLARSQGVGLLTPRTVSLALAEVAWLECVDVETPILESGVSELNGLPEVLRCLAALARRDRNALEEMGLQDWPTVAGSADCRLHEPRDVLSLVNAHCLNWCLQDALASSRRGTASVYVGRLLLGLERQLSWKSMVRQVGPT